ncbi:2-oxoisovalerate dehydrogenase complex, E1 component, alpha subunit [Trichinella spiralis]|uniref:2-oxoisovalerate dehydrogenase complex, E1 component, alpha subunit n=1 Tax=Trichinella spiralis TaxID=6334 RepID=UPI0001EFBA77|nr:2-oxoisovalerate dehydrogenase complex, E1 component, alpha subunit [Trichinella spiralis]
MDDDVVVDEAQLGKLELNDGEYSGVSDPQLMLDILDAKQKEPSAFVSGWEEMDNTGIIPDENVENDPGKKLLAAAEKGDADEVVNLLKCDRSLVHVRDRDFYTPLHRAAYNNHVSVIKVLLANGADISAQTEDGWQPLHCAARWGNLESVKILLHMGKADINARSNSGLTPLHIAASEQPSLFTAEYLLSQPEIDPSIRSKTGETAMDIARRTFKWCSMFDWLFVDEQKNATYLYNASAYFGHFGAHQLCFICRSGFIGYEVKLQRQLIFGGCLFTRKQFCDVSRKTDEILINQFKEKFFSNRMIKFTDQLHFVNDKGENALPVFRIIDNLGNVVNAEMIKAFSADLCMRMYKKMLLVHVVDEILYNAQRQGRISFYLTNDGEEATQIGSASALQADDLIYAQYRELGTLLWRDFPLQSLMDQCVGNADDLNKGRQMPVHYGSKELNVVTISSTLATQMPQAVGSAYAMKLRKKQNLVICYFGDGAASEGDCHAAFNFAGTLRCPVVFFCRNNGYAISTCSSEQYAGDGIGSRGPAYGLNTVRVDGNDVFAVHMATLHARQMALHCEPCLIEAITYRLGHHSTSDDSTAYRSAAEIQLWQKSNSPLARLRAYLFNSGLLDEKQEQSLQKTYRQEVLNSLILSEKKPKPEIETLFTDVYDQMTPRIQKQYNELKTALAARENLE